MIYYGDEVGMVGLTDPDCRRGMLWDEAGQDRELFRWFQRLIALRREQPVLRTGRTRTVWADSITSVSGVVRFQGREQVLVLLNNSPEEQRVDLRQISWPGRTPRQLRDLLADAKRTPAEVVLEP